MARLLSDEDIDAIAQRLVSFSGLTNEEHKKHHEAFAIYIAQQTKKALFWERMQEKIGGFVILGMLGGLCTAVWHGFLWVLNRGH